jgi:hypothetical protein
MVGTPSTVRRGATLDADDRAPDGAGGFGRQCSGCWEVPTASSWVDPSSRGRNGSRYAGSRLRGCLADIIPRSIAGRVPHLSSAHADSSSLLVLAQALLMPRHFHAGLVQVVIAAFWFRSFAEFTNQPRQLLRCFLDGDLAFLDRRQVRSA